MTYRRTIVFADGAIDPASGLTPYPFITANGFYPSAAGCPFQGGSALFCASGTLGGGTYQAQSKLPDGTWQNIPGASTTTAAMVPFYAPEGNIRLVVTGATTPSASAWGFYFPSGTAFASTSSSGGGGSGAITAPLGPTGGVQVEGTVIPGNNATGNPVEAGAVAQNQAYPTYAPGQLSPLQVDLQGNLRTTQVFSAQVAGDAVSNNNVVYAGVRGQNYGFPVAQMVGPLVYDPNAGSWQRTRGTLQGSWSVLKPEAQGGGLIAKIIAAASTNATAVKSTVAVVHGIEVFNSGAAACYLKLYNKSTAPTVGTDIPVATIAIPAGGAREVSRPLGYAFSTGLAYAITTGFADSDTGAVTAGQVVGSVTYI